MFACFYIADFSVQACLLPEMVETREALKQSPLAVLDGPNNLPRVFAANFAARRAGIQIGMTKLQVETYGGVLLRKRSIVAEETAQALLVDFAGMYSPRVESTCPGVAILDLAGMEKLLGSWGSAIRIMSAKAAEVGFDLRIAVASNADTALLAAQGFSANTIISAGEEARRLATLHVGVLPISPEMLETLDRWGIRTLQSLAALPTVAIVERLGQEGLHLQKLARGQTRRPLLMIEPSAELAEIFEFEDPVETLESIFFILNRMLQQLCTKLIDAALAANELRLTIGLEVRQIQNGEKREEQWKQEWKLPLPTQDKNLLFGLVRLQLERTTFSAPVRRMRLEVVPSKPRIAQGDLFAPPAPEPEKLEITLERICGVVGSTDENGTCCVGTPQLLDTHKPGSFAVGHFSSAHEGDSSARTSSLAQSEPVIALRVFRPAIETSVELDGEKPHFVWLWHRHRRVLAASGPWFSSGHWWNSSAWVRDEWDVILKTPAGLGFYRIYRDRTRQRWFVEGVFD